MRWQRPARWFVAIAGLGFAVALYVQTRERPVDDRPAIATPADPEASVQSGGGTDVRFRNGDVEFTIEHDGMRLYPDRTEYDKARFRVDDGTFLGADHVVVSGEGADGQPGEMKLTGSVMMDTSEGAAIRTGEATYVSSTGVAIMPGAVTFTRGRISGSGTGGEYHRSTGVFHVLADARIETRADASGGRVEASARSMTFNRAGLALLFDQDARIVHDRQHMAADRATLYLTENQDQFRVIELRGRAAVVPVEGHASTAPEMHARDIDLSFHEGTQMLERALLTGGASMVMVEGEGRRSIEAVEIALNMAADGRTVTHLDARDRVTVQTPPRPKQTARTITAASMVADGDERSGLTSATFRGGVRFVETAVATAGRKPGERVGTSGILTMKLAGQLDNVEAARFEENVRFVAGDIEGDADIGDYAASAGTLTLRPGRVPSKYPRVTSARVTVDARELIDVDLGTEDLHARGDVKTVNAAGSGAAPRGGLFNDRDAMYGFGAEFWYEGGERRARYRGTDSAPARVSQGDTVVIGLAIELVEQTQDLTARGRVDATFLAASGQTPSEAPRKYRVLSDTLEYREKARAATYSGAPVTLTGPDGVTRARTMVMTLAAEGRTIDRLDAKADVHLVLTQGREALADSLLYEAALGRYTLRGQPLVLRAEGDSPGTCSQSRGRVAHFTAGGGSPVFPPAENGLVERRDVSCTGTLQK
jgi:lipopolysaccharide export system protein LptA